MAKTIKGRKIFNATPHSINFDVDGEIVIIEAPEKQYIISAVAEEKQVTEIFVTTNFVGNTEGKKIIERIWEQHGDDIIIVGSIIAAQAYPGDVVAMTPAKGYERVAPAEKRMNPDKFTIFKN